MAPTESPSFCPIPAPDGAEIGQNIALPSGAGAPEGKAERSAEALTRLGTPLGCRRVSGGSLIFRRGDHSPRRKIRCTSVRCVSAAIRSFAAAKL